MNARIGGALALLALLGLGTAQAQPATTVPGYAKPQRSVFLVLYGGLTFGGDELAEAQVTTLPPYGGAYTFTDTVRAGGLFQFGAGVLWQPSDVPLAVQATVGYHADGISADNGDITFSRVPFEALAFYTGVPRWRFGGGARFVRNAELEYDFGRRDVFRFKDTTGVVLEAGYEVAPRFWINLRYVDEDYEVRSLNGMEVIPLGKSSGRSGGINLTVAF
jgi:hypothetical protein